MKRALSILLALLCLFACASTALAATTTPASGYCGENGGTNVSWSLDAKGNLSITGKGRMADYNYYYDYDDQWNESILGNKPPWFDFKLSLKSITIGEGVTNVGRQAFQDAFAKNVTLPSTITEIGEDAFCLSLVEQITLPSGLKKIGEMAFFTCSYLQSINIPASVTEIGDSALAYCGSLTSINVDAANPNYSSIDGVLFNKDKTKLLVYPGAKYEFNADYTLVYTVPATVEGIQTGAFVETRVQSLTIPSSVKWIDSGICSQYDMLTSVYFEGNAPTLAPANALRPSLPKTATLYYTPGTSGWTDSSAYDAKAGTWNGYTLKAIETQQADGRFSDVAKSAYYYDAVYWAFDHGVTTGKSATSFAPLDSCTRGEVATFLWRAMGKPEPQTTTNPFTDVKESDYYYKPILWAVEQGITNGTSATTFSPAQKCTSAHILTFLWRAMGEPFQLGSGEHQWYEAAAQWAKLEHLLDSTSAESSLTGNCPRGDVVTFLYRALAD